MNTKRLLPFLGAAALTFAGCSSDSTDASPAASSDPAAAEAVPGVVTIARSRFAPLDVTVPTGTTVTFENTDPFAHTVTARDDSAVAFDSGSLGESETFEVAFDQAGTFAYFCEIHPTMRATVTVQ